MIGSCAARFAAVIACVVVLAGCSPSGGDGSVVAMAPSASLPASAPPVASPGDVLPVSTGDVLEVRVFGQPDLTGTWRSTGRGRSCCR